MANKSARESLNAWQSSTDGADRCFSVYVESELAEGASRKKQIAAGEAASFLLSLPWELLHDDGGYLFQGRRAVRVRRRLPNRRRQDVVASGLPIRILLVSPRPEDDSTAYIDHRISAKPLIEAIESLGELATLTLLTPPTFPDLQKALKRADEAGEPFDVVHFDGHGVYDKKVGLGALCFEDPKDANKIEKRESELIHAEKMAEVMRDYRVPLVFLEACQSAMTEEDPTASVAARLLEEGVASVVAMSHSVLVETARRFVKAFYEEMARGARVGAAMIAGQRALYGDTYRIKIMGAGELRLQDWFVPVLYQEELDPQLITRLQPEAVRQLHEKQRRLRLGHLPEPPSHNFQGRSRELLSLERLLHEHNYAVVRGQGGAGKTTLAVELARWLVRVSRFRRAAFVTLEYFSDVRGLIDSLGKQLLPEGDGWSVATYGDDLKKALQPIERALSDQSTIIVFDNLESILPDASGQAPIAAPPYEDVFDLCRALLEASKATRILFTSREPLPAPFDHKQREVVLGALSKEDAVEMVSQVMADEGMVPKSEDPGGDPQEVVDLVEAVNRHARALVLIAREVSRQGVRVTTENLHKLMEDLHRRYPDDRENSLYASVELSLRRLSPEMREQVKALSVFHGGAHIFVLGHVLGVDEETARKLCIALIETGLAEDMGYGHLRVDPALPSYLSREMSEEEEKEVMARWAEGMIGLIAFLYEQKFKDARIAHHLILLELPNLIASLKWIQGKATPEDVVGLANTVEDLLSRLGRPQALAQATRVREQAARQLGEWGHAQFLTESASIDQLLNRGEFQSALTVAQQLLRRCLEAGDTAFPEASYDVALAHLRLGRVLRSGGDAEAAIPLLTQAQWRFQVLADKGDDDAELLAPAAISEIAVCLTELGRLDEAVTAYEEASGRAEKLGDKRGVAVRKDNLGIVHMLQGHYDKALQAHAEARDIFEKLGEPESVAYAWHHIGMVYRLTKRLEQAERAYQQSLAIRVQHKAIVGEADSLAELGNLYDDMGRSEDAVKFFRQAADIYAKMGHQRGEGLVRNNMANTLINLQSYGEARREVLRAIECGEPYGHAAKLWMTWNLLHGLEQAIDNLQAADDARQQAIQSYLAYRRDGGQSSQPGAQLCALAEQAITQGDTTELEQVLAQLSREDVPPSAKVFIPKLQAILQGDRDPALADDPNLDYDDAVELQLLLEALQSDK
ncbi:MAG: tetratricopeptide repeat protein [Acidobacteriota bacterium]